MTNIAKHNESRSLNTFPDYAEIFQLGILVILPFAALAGNVAADAALILTCAIFLSTYKGSVKHILNNLA